MAQPERRIQQADARAERSRYVGAVEPLRVEVGSGIASVDLELLELSADVLVNALLSLPRGRRRAST